MALGVGNEFGVKINGTPKLDAWFERDVSFIKISSDQTNFAEPFVVNGQTEAVVQVLQTRGTVIAMSKGSNTAADQVLHVIFGHAAGYFMPDIDGKDVLAQLELELEAHPSLAGSNFTVELFDGFDCAGTVLHTAANT